METFTSTVLSTVAARSNLGQGASCFCPEIIIVGVAHSAFFIFGQLLDGLIACGWEDASNVGACKAEFQSFVREQRQLECHASKKDSDLSSTPEWVWVFPEFVPCEFSMTSSCFIVVSSEHCYEFEVFQLTTLYLRGTLEDTNES